MKLWLASAIAVLTALPYSAVAEVPITTQTSDDAMQAYGYHVGQNLWLERISKEFPSLSRRSKLAGLQFDLTFGDSIKEIDRQFDKHGTEKWRQLKSELEDQASTFSAQSQITHEAADAFIGEVLERAGGNIESPILETLLIYSPKYQKSPAAEYTDGFRRFHDNDGSGKAKGLAFRLQVPSSWKSSEGNRPNIPVKFISENGRGNRKILVLVYNMTLENGDFITKADIAEMLADKDKQSYLPDGALYKASGALVLENKPGYWMSYSMTGQRMSASIDTRAIAYSVFVDGLMIQIQGAVISQTGSGVDLEKEFLRYKPVFEQVADSLVLPGLYKR